MDNILEIINIAKFIVGGMGILGVILVVTGKFSQQMELIQKGGLLIVASVVLFVCGYFIIKKTEQRAEEEMIEFYYEKMQERQ